ncbi:MAG TPA: GerMN domain-containing protein [Candidatus Saccharimonadales bacterium]|nr:GerMN domain-containing protein [Candidatus Saccharimonadales bacterium]
MKKWLIPVFALVLVAIIALLTQQFVLKGTDKEHYSIYLLALDDDGRRGKKLSCGDSLVKVERQTVSDIRLSDVYQDLLGLKDQQDEATGLTNALHQSSLVVDSATIQDGVARVYLSGTLAAADECDQTRVRAQLEEPGRQFGGIRSVEVYINNTPLSEALKQ